MQYSIPCYEGKHKKCSFTYCKCNCHKKGGNVKKLFLILVLLLAAVTFYTNASNANECPEAGCQGESQYGYTRGRGI